ncbi:hypothetical protein AK88_04755 [Plasmodium fragile]|uniref:Uncharacterized protein n=1 Tax=Plasmodium fragile TaxID=5857 RepID=A0A0D9QF31_PLAFR|nr:uncharacterized protein AK88_04755 [Plasmodium fragile]KJP85588.1 hypothetical protein AK88_04755 [Plasmodium fragile]
MDINTLKEKNICIDDLSRAHKEKYTTFFLLNPDGILDSVAGLENLAFSFEDISYKNIRCYKCLSVFTCESSAVYRACPKCHVVNALVPQDNIGRKVIILICYHCNSRNLTNIDCSYVKCFLCSRVNLSQYHSAHFIAPSHSAHPSSNRKQRKKLRRLFANMFKCLRLKKKKKRDVSPSSGNSAKESCEESQSGEEAQSEVEHGSIHNNASIEEGRENDREENPHGQRENNKKLFSEDNTHGYEPDIKYTNEDYRKKFSKTNNSLYNSNMNYMPYQNDKFQNDYMRNSMSNNAQMGYMKKGTNEYCNPYMGNSYNNNMRVGNPSVGYSRENNNFYNMKYDKNYQPSYSHNNMNPNYWNKDNKVYGNNYHDMHRPEKYNDKYGTVVESGNVKRKTLMFNNISDSNQKKVYKPMNVLEMDKKRDSDVRACIEYFNSLRKNKNDDIKMILENQNFKEFNIPREHLENRDFYRYVEYYKKHNLRDIIDQFNEYGANDKNRNKDKANESGSSKGYDKGKGGAEDPSRNEKNTSGKSTDSKSKKNKRPENDSRDNSDGDGSAYHKKKKTKCDQNIKPTFYTLEDLFD